MPVWAADVIVFTDGDRITGEITKIWDGEITIEPAYADEFQVDIDFVANIHAKRDFDVELADGRSVVAQLHGADEDGRQIVVIDGDATALPLSELTELEVPEDPFEWESNVDWSASLNTGNTESLNTKLRADALIRFGDHRHISDVSFIREEQNFVSTKEQDMLTYNYNWLFRDAWFFSTGFRFERDPIRELDYRVVGSAGLGMDIWDEPRRRLNVQLGLGYIQEEIGLTNETSSVGIWGLRYRQDFFSEDLELFHDQAITRYLSGRDNTIYNTSTGVRYEITDLLYANISLDFDYETQPVSTASNEDIALLFGIGMEF